MLKHVPNILTCSRVVGVFVGIYYLLTYTYGNACIAIGIFVLVALTDFFDGYLARKYNLISAFGKIMDPIADKVFILSLYVVFVLVGITSWWLVIPICFREISITVIRLILMRREIVIAADKSGKIKTVFQNVSLIFLMGAFLQKEYWQLTHDVMQHMLPYSVQIIMGIVLILTLYSGYEFFQKNKEYIFL